MTFLFFLIPLALVFGHSAVAPCVWVYAFYALVFPPHSGSRSCWSRNYDSTFFDNTPKMRNVAEVKNNQESFFISNV